jgi:hypothetical protein
MTCVSCGNEWLVVNKRNIMVCKDCYEEVRRKNIKYHKLQDQAYIELENGDKDNAINLLRLVQKERESLGIFIKREGWGHYAFREIFLEDLIIGLIKSENPIRTWKNFFDNVESYIL